MQSRAVALILVNRSPLKQKPRQSPTISKKRVVTTTLPNSCSTVDQLEWGGRIHRILKRHYWVEAPHYGFVAYIIYLCLRRVADIERRSFISYTREVLTAYRMNHPTTQCQVLLLSDLRSAFSSHTVPYMPPLTNSFTLLLNYLAAKQLHSLAAYYLTTHECTHK